MTMESVPVGEISPALLAEVQEFLDTQDTGHPFQFPQWGDSHSKVMLLRKEGRICWLGTFGLQTPLGRRFPWVRALIANRGPVCDDHQFWEQGVEELAENMRQERFAYLDVLPEWIRQADADHPTFAHNFKWHNIGGSRATLRLDLEPAEDDIFARFRKTARYEVRRAERLGAVVSAASGGEVDEFLCFYQRMAERKGFVPNPIKHVRRILHWLIASESRGALLLARAEGTIHGGVMIARAGRRCWYILGATDREDRMAVGHILQWKAILWAKSRGCTEYDFGGYTPGATSGPAWFKEGFGGRVVHLVALRRRMIERNRYNIFRAISGIRNWI